MGFVQAGFLFALVALAIPLLVHLLSRWQVRRLEFGTTRFLKEVIHNAARRRRVRRWLLLMTRLALLAVLCLLFARPFLATQEHQDGKRLRIVLLDRSASMMMTGQSGRVLDDAISAATKLIDQAGSDIEVEWAWFDRYVEPLPAGTRRPSLAKSTSADTDYVAALSWARDRLAATPGANAEVLLVSDMQLSGLANETLVNGSASQRASSGAVRNLALDRKRDTSDNTAVNTAREPASEPASAMGLGQLLGFPSNVPVRIVDVGRTAANNLAITSLASQATLLPAGSDLKIEATLFNYAALPAEDVPATALATCGRKSIRLKKTINVAADQAEEAVFDFGRVDSGVWEVSVEIDANDDLAVDNRRLTSVEIVSPIGILVLDPGASAASDTASSYYLTTALQQVQSHAVGSEKNETQAEKEETAAVGRFAVDQWFLEDQGIPNLDLKKYPLVVVADAGVLAGSAIQELQQYVLSGGKLLVFAGQSMTSQDAQEWSSSRLAPGTLTRPESAAVMPFRIVSIADQGSMLEPFRDPQHGDLTRLAFTSLVRTEVADGTHVLAWFDQRAPAITEHRIGAGRVAWFLSSVDNRSSNWTISPLYLPLVRQMAGDLLGITGEGPIRFRNVGDLKEQEEWKARTELAVADISTNHRSAMVSAVKVPAAKVPAAKSAANDSVLRPVSRELSGRDVESRDTFDQPGFERRAEALYVINTLPKESDPTRIEVQEFAEHCQLTLAGEPAEETGALEARGRQELWPWMAAALIILLVAEFALANRTPA